ncbi:hypothetical protein KFE98_17755 [bacterium SCSIO 12741]|nr:hypothetical protein KFE98_17755 [bacterium SCSIO 12741]
MHYIEIPEEIRENYRHAINEARKDRPRYLEWIQAEIGTLISLINQYDKHYVLGALGSKLIKSTPTLYSTFLQANTDSSPQRIDEDSIEEDDEIETLLEYAMSISLASGNNNANLIPTEADLESIFNQLSKIKTNVNFWEISAEIPKDGDQFDHWLRTSIMTDTMNVRGNGYQIHIMEVFKEVFTPHDGFLIQYYGFGSNDILQTILKLDNLVYSKVGNPFGATQSHERLKRWMENVGEAEVQRKMIETGMHFIQQFTQANPDLYDPESPNQVTSHSLDRIASFKTIFWVIPETDTELKIFDRISCEFDENQNFLTPPKFKAFPLNDSIIKLKPLIKDEGRYYHYSMSLPFRNLFGIVEGMIKDADSVYYEHSYKGNSNQNSRDNYLERKVKSLFEKIAPTANFYHSLKYDFIDNGQLKSTELDILGVSNDTVYIVEVKAGELNTKQRRGALKGLKDRISETIGEGSYQCHRALGYIQENQSANFSYTEDGVGKQLTIDKSKIKNYHKISVTLEHFSAISANLKYLVNAGLIDPAYKWSWIVSLYDLMVFAELIESEEDFKDYLSHRLALYERNDITFSDEIDMLGFFLEGKFPLGDEKENQHISIVNYKRNIDNYYDNRTVGLPNAVKPKKKRIS